MLEARYSSGSSGLAPCAFWTSSSACFASKASEMYLRKIRPRTTCLYSAASMLLRSASAAAQSLASKPIVAVVLLFFDLLFAIKSTPSLSWVSWGWYVPSASAGAPFTIAKNSTVDKLENPLHDLPHQSRENER